MGIVVLEKWKLQWAPYEQLVMPYALILLQQPFSDSFSASCLLPSERHG